MRREFIYNKSTLKPRRQQLRNKPTAAEKILWKHLKNKQLGFWFKRQVSITAYVVDFYCPQKKLAIELDGSPHKTTSQQKYDKYRSDYLRSFNIKVIRFWNHKAISNPSKVVEEIRIHLNTPTPTPPPKIYSTLNPSPKLGEGNKKGGVFNRGGMERE